MYLYFIELVAYKYNFLEKVKMPDFIMAQVQKNKEGFNCVRKAAAIIERQIQHQQLTIHDNSLTASFAKYVAIKSAPALFMAVNVSNIALFSSIQPFSAAAFIMAYSPLIL